MTTPMGGITSTTRYGQLEQPLDICGTVALNGASFVSRSTTFDRGLSDLIVKAIRNDGFSLIDIWELCTAHYAPINKFGKRALDDKLLELGFETGIIKNFDKPEFSLNYRDSHAHIAGEETQGSEPIKPSFQISLEDKIHLVLAGAAGTKINSAASLFGLGGILSGLWVTQRDDYPVTVKSGHSISEIILGPKEIKFTGITKPDVMIVLFPQGLEKSWSLIDKLTHKDVLVISSDLPEIKTPAKKISIDFISSNEWGSRKEYWAVMALAILLDQNEYYPLVNFKESIAKQPRFASKNLAALEARKLLDVQIG